MFNVLYELERVGWGSESGGPSAVKCRCPFHDDTRASASVSLDTGAFKCYTASCGMSGDFISFIARILSTARAVVETDFATRYNFEEVKTIDVHVVERAHAGIWEHDALRNELYKRGVTDDAIRLYRIGAKDGRVWIPIKNRHGLYVNIRKYLPGAPGADKMRNMRGRGNPMRLYPIEQLQYETVVLCGGEMKAVAAALKLNAHDIGAVSATGGEGNWHPSLTQEFKGLKVYILMDIDEAGIAAANLLAPVLARVAKWVGIVRLPLDIDKYPHGDVNDFIMEGGDLLSVITTTPEWVPPRQAIDPNVAAVACRLSNTVFPTNVGRKMKFEGVVAAAGEHTFIVPKAIEVKCSKSEKMCSVCAVYPADQTVWTIHPDSPAILHMVNTHSDSLDKGIRAALCIPGNCRAVTFNVSEYHQCADVRLNPTLAISNRDTDRTMTPAVIVGSATELNAPYTLTGRMYPHPQNQVATLVISEHEAAVDALSQYVPDDMDKLKVFQPDKWTVAGIKRKLLEIYDDLSCNVTRICHRHDLHLAVDLAYHSPLVINLEGKDVKAWTEVLVLGDSACGKTETASGLQAHYQLGERVEAKNASTAGLLGGLTQLGNAWYVQWGVIPTQDRRLVCIEEVKGAPTTVISQLTDMRSSGIAELPKIKRQRTHARTRLLWVSNPRDSRNMASYNYGVNAIPELFGAPEDVRRLDAALIVTNKDITSADINEFRSAPPAVPHVFTSDLCHELLLWVWTRRPHEIGFDDGVVRLAGDLGVELCDEFSETIPLVDRGSMRQKILRLACAVAGRTFSCVGDFKLYVRKAHVEFVAATLREWYSSDSFGYAAFSNTQKASNTLRDTDVLKFTIQSLPWPEDFKESILQADMFDMQDIMDWNAWEKVQAQSLITLLVRKRAIVRHDRVYRKTDGFIQWLRNTAFESVPTATTSEERF